MTTAQGAEELAGEGKPRAKRMPNEPGDDKDGPRNKTISILRDLGVLCGFDFFQSFHFL
jgi:hypothetical protein